MISSVDNRLFSVGDKLGFEGMWSDHMCRDRSKSVAALFSKLHFVLLGKEAAGINRQPFLFGLSLHIQRLRVRSDSQLPSLLQPPSTDSACPLTNPLSLPSAKKAMARAMSSGDANRAMGMRPVMSASV